MYILAIAGSFVLTAIAFQAIRLVERKIDSNRYLRFSMNFAVPILILFAAANSYAVYIKAAPGYFILLDTLLLTAVVSSYQDLKYREIEDEVHILALIAGLAGLLVRGFNLLDSILGLLTAGGILLLIAVLTRGGMGGADIKLNAVYGMILGLKLSVLSLLLAFTVGAVTSLLLIMFRIKGRKDVIPFSPFLSVGALVSFAFGDSMINSYISFLNG